MAERGIVLIVDDEKMIREAVSAYFTRMGYRICEADNGRDALKLALDKNVLCVILDLMLPGLSGEEVCREIRKTSRVPIIMLTAKVREENVLNGLNIGADDYVTKPFSVKELFARMEAVLRRTSGEKGPLASVLSWDDLSVDLDNREVRKAGESVSLTRSEWRILSAMVSFPKKVFSREELMELALSEDSESLERVIDTHIKNLRKKVETDPREPVFIKTVHGFGYKFGFDGAGP